MTEEDTNQNKQNILVALAWHYCYTELMYNEAAAYSLPQDRERSSTSIFWGKNLAYSDHGENYL